MKKIALIFLIPFLSFSQSLSKDSILIITKFSEDNELLKNFHESNCTTNYVDYKYKTRYVDSLFFISDIFKCKKYSSDKETYFIKGFLLGEQYYSEIPENKIIIADKEKISVDSLYYELKNLPSEARQKIENVAKYNSEIDKEVYKNKLLDEVLSYEKYGIGIINANPTSNYSMTGAEFRIMNFSKKTIKYITFNFYGKNAVKDKVQYRKGVYAVSRKGIGPVEQYTISSWEFDDVWLTDIVEYLTLTSVSIIYMDGTSKIIKITDNMWIDEDKINLANDLIKEEEK